MEERGESPKCPQCNALHVQETDVLTSKVPLCFVKRQQFECMYLHMPNFPGV